MSTNKITLEELITRDFRNRGHAIIKTNIYYYDPYPAQDLYDRATLYTGHLKPQKYGSAPNRLYAIPYCHGGDYANTSTVERSNYLIMAETFAPDNEDQLPGLWTAYGGYGSYGIYIDLDLEIEIDEDRDPVDVRYTELAEIIRGLDDYPIVDEDHFSDFEYHVCFEENFDDWLDHDIAYALERMERDDAEDLRDQYESLEYDTRLSLFYAWPRWENEGPEYESGCGLVIRNDDGSYGTEDLVTWMANALTQTKTYALRDAETGEEIDHKNLTLPEVEKYNRDLTDADAPVHVQWVETSIQKELL